MSKVDPQRANESASNNSPRMPSLAPSRDEIAQRQHVKGGKAKTKSTSAPSTRKPDSGGGVSASSVFLLVAMLLALGAGGAWFLWQQIVSLQKELSASQNALSQSSSMLGSLENQLANTGTELNKTGNEVQKTLAVHDSEIRKLWDLSNKKNRPDIDEHETAIRQIRTAIKEVRSKLDTANNTVDSQAKLIASQKKLLQKYESDLASLKADVKEQATTLQNVRLEMDEQVGQDGLSTEVSANSEAIESINLFRQQTNSNIIQLQEEMRELNQKVSGTVPLQ